MYSRYCTCSVVHIYAFNISTYFQRERERDRQTERERERDRQTDRQKETETDRQTNKWIQLIYTKKKE
jgi:hypothetical protein